MVADLCIVCEPLYINVGGHHDNRNRHKLLEMTLKAMVESEDMINEEMEAVD